MRIQHNIMAMSAYRNYSNNVSSMQKNLEKLSSGYKINRAGDDAAGLAISEKMRAQIKGLETAQKNAKDGISLVKTAEGALTEVHDMLNRMVELATMSANGTYDNATDRFQLQKEVDQLRSEINRIADSSNFNGINLLDGSMSTAASKIGSVEITSAGNAGSVTYTVASDVLTWASTAITDATITQQPSASLTHLHSAGKDGTIGEFTIDLGGLQVVAGSATTSITITIGSATYTYQAGASKAGTTITASMVASDLATKNVYVTGSGTLTIATTADASTTVGKNGIIYTVTASGNKVTFKATTLVTASAAIASLGASNSLTLTASNTNRIPQGMDVSHNYTVSASITGADPAQGFVQVGVTKYTNMKADDPKQFGQAVVGLDVTKLQHGMTIEVNGVTKTFKLSDEDVDATGTDVIDLSDLVAAAATSAVLASTVKAEVAQRIANAFAHDDTDGVEIGVNSNNDLIVAEKVDENRKSVAGSDVQKAMEDYDTFKDLVKFKSVTKTGAAAGKAELTINTGKLTDGKKIVINNGKGTETSYTITTDKANDGKTGYVYVDDPKNTASALAAAIGSTATAVGKDVIIKFATKGGTTDAAKTGISAKLVGNKSLRLQIGDTADKFNQLDVTINDCHTESLGIADISIADQDSAAKAIDAIKDAINYVSDVRGTLGATQNRLDHTINNLGVMTENIQDAESTIRDTDVADEMMAYTKNNILIQSAQAMLAQANQVPQGVLQLLG